MSTAIKEGDTVIVTGLRDSARCPHMVVIRIHNDRVTTFWFDRDIRLQTATFTAAELQKVDLQ